MRGLIRQGGRLVLVLWVSLAAGVAGAADEHLIVRCAKPYTDVVATVQGLGGQVHHEFRNVDAIAVSLPDGARVALEALVGEAAITKDTTVDRPAPVEELQLNEQPLWAAALEPQDLVDYGRAQPDDYLFNNALIGAAELHGMGYFGDGVTVAVIDSGTAAVSSLTGRVLGGENFVPGAGEPSANSPLNDPHGTWVGSTIAANALFGFLNGSALAGSLAAHAPDSVWCVADVALDPPACPGGANGVAAVPMLGVAPFAELYALKVFPASGGGAPESRIIAAMDRAITLRRNYNGGAPQTPVAGSGTAADPYVYDALKIDVVNMSLGGPTLFAGRDLEDQLTQEMLEVGITIVASAGNDGHAAITGGSPGTGLGSLTVGAASTAPHERILRDLQFGPGIGVLYRPTTHQQMATFSSRGPTADGRVDPDVVANGLATFAQSASGGLSLVSGTSFSAPTVAGAAALLREAAPSASAVEVRNALHETADPDVLGDAFGAIDQGAGYIDTAAAYEALSSGHVSSKLPDADPGKGRHRRHRGHGKDHYGDDVEKNLRNADLRPVHFRRDRFSASVRDLLPGEVAHFFVPVDERTDELVVTLSGITPELPPAQQNAFFGDDIYLKIVDAPTSIESLLVEDFVVADSSYPIAAPQTGLVRVALMGDWTNAGRISADLTVERLRTHEGKSSAKGHVEQDEVETFAVAVPPGTGQAVFELSWKEDWGRYPTNDLDMVLTDPLGTVDVSGATLDSPERVVIDDPAPGIWTVEVTGFTVHDSSGKDAEPDDDDQGKGDKKGGPGKGHGHDKPAREKFELRVTVDGELLRLED